MVARVLAGGGDMSNSSSRRLIVLALALTHLETRPYHQALGLDLTGAAVLDL